MARARILNCALFFLALLSNRVSATGFQYIVDEDLFRERLVGIDDRGRRYPTTHPYSISVDGYDGLTEKPVFPITKNLHTSTNRAEVYSRVLLEVVTRPALAEEWATAANQLIDLIGTIDGGLDVVETAEWAGDVLAFEADLKYIRGNSEWTRLLNQAKTAGRAKRAGDFTAASYAIRALKGVVLLSDLSTRATLLNALATDQARQELELLREFVRSDSRPEIDDPELVAGLNPALETLSARDESWWRAFAEEAEREAAEIAHFGLDLGLLVVSHKVALTMGASAGHAVSFWALPLAAGFASWNLVSDTTRAHENAILSSLLVRRLHLAPARHANAALLDMNGRYAQYHYYEAMQRSLSTWGAKTLSWIHGDIREFRDRYELRTALAYEILVGPSSAAGAEVVLIIDSSGSMKQNDPTDLRLSAARLFAEQKGPELGVATVDFDEHARVLANGLSAGANSAAEVARSVDRVDHSGGTNLGVGLRAAHSLLDGGTARLTSRSAVLLTDGKGEYGGEAGLFADRGWSIFTIGLTGAVDEALLTAIAVQTGGEYFKAHTAADLQGVLGIVAGRHSNEAALLLASESIGPGEERVYTFTLDDAISEILARLFWPGSDLDLTLIDPAGVEWTVDRAKRAGAMGVTASTYEQFRIPAPVRGTWSARVKAVRVPVTGEPFDLQIGGPSALRVDLSHARQDTARGSVLLPVRLRSARGTPPRVSNLQVAVQAPSGAEQVCVDEHDPYQQIPLRTVEYLPEESGDHVFTTRIQGTSAAGSPFTRVETRTIYVGSATVQRNAGRVVERAGAFLTINLGRRNGIQAGMTVELTKIGGGEVIGSGTVISVQESQSSVEIQKLYGLASADPGTPARIVREEWLQEK